jgi:hypothetical protein
MTPNSEYLVISPCTGGYFTRREWGYFGCRRNKSLI